MKIPGFTAELSLTRKGNYYKRFATHSMTSPGTIQPAARLIAIPRTTCWCAQWGMIEEGDEGLFFGFKTLVEGCERWECVIVPVFLEI